MKFLARAVSLATAVCAGPLSVAAADEPLHLMFPHDYLSLSKEARHHYILGVTDARLSALVGKARLGVLSQCLARVGISRVTQVAEETVIPTIGAAATPMPFIVDRSIQLACGPTADRR